MTGAEFEAKRISWNLTRHDLGKMFFSTIRAVDKWRVGECRVPGPVIMMLRLLDMLPDQVRIRCINKLLGK